MGLIDEAIEIGARKQGPRCKVSKRKQRRPLLLWLAKQRDAS